MAFLNRIIDRDYPHPDSLEILFKDLAAMTVEWIGEKIVVIIDDHNGEDTMPYTCKLKSADVRDGYVFVTIADGLYKGVEVFAGSWEDMSGAEQAAYNEQFRKY